MEKFGGVRLADSMWDPERDVKELLVCKESWRGVESRAKRMKDMINTLAKLKPVFQPNLSATNCLTYTMTVVVGTILIVKACHIWFIRV